MNVVTLLSHKYGYRSFPTVMETSEFEKILTAVSFEEVKQLLTKWFKKDDNAVPPTYVLQPISSHLPDFLSNEKSLRSEAANQWWEESAAMQTAIGQAAFTCLGKERAHTMMQSVTEAEIREGMLANSALLQRSLWFYRHIEDIDTIETSRLSSRFKDGRGDAAMQEESRCLLEKLKTELTSLLPPHLLHRYAVRWDADTGINPGKDAKHKQYIDKFCQDFEQHLKEMAQAAITAREQQHHRVNALVEEVTQHTRFCQEKCANFFGRQDALERTQAYLKDRNPGRVLVIHGKSGSGKTSIMAMAARQACKQHKGKGIVVLRFLGTSPDSTSVVSLLRSILHQLTAAKSRSIDQEDLPTNVKDLSERLKETLGEVAGRTFPVTLLLDSLDQLDPGHSSRQLAWLPTLLPRHVRVLVSTLPEAHYQVFPTLQAMYEGDTSNFYEIPTLDDNDVSGILDQWLAAAQRGLSANQRELVLKAFKACPLPLFLKLSFDAAVKWSSYSLPERTVLQSTVRESINVMFAELERAHGKTLVSHALAYLTLSRGGLTEAELEDILSCDDDVLNDVYMYWTPPVRRLPPLLLVRIKADLGQYLVDRGADGVGVFFWYHRQFVEAAFDRYCDDATLRSAFHGAMADYFSGVWAGGKPKPYTDKKGNSSQADRIVSPQPFMFGNSFNLRKLNNLPFHALQARNVGQLKTECLLNFQFLQAKIIACGTRAVLEDYSACRKMMSREKEEAEDVEVVAQTLQLSQDALQYDPLQLPAQLLSRIVSPSQGVKPFLQQCRTGSDAPFLLPSQPIMVAPGGQLLHSLNEHTSDVMAMAMTADGKLVVTCSYDESLCITDVEEGRRVRSIEGVGEDCEQVFLCCHDSVVVAVANSVMSAYELNTGNRMWSEEIIGSSLLVAICGGGRSLIVAFDMDDGTVVMDAKTGSHIRQLSLPSDAETITAPLPTCGQERYAATTNSELDRILLLDLKEDHFHLSPQMVRQSPFPRSGDDDGDDDDDDRAFMAEGLALSPDGARVYCANSVDNDLHVLQVPTFRVLKVLKGSTKDSSDKFHVTDDGRYLYFSNRRAVRVWDLELDRKASALLHVNMLYDVATVDMRNFVTLADDRLIRIWDLGRGLSDRKSTSLEFKDVSVWTPEGGVQAKEAGGDDHEDDQARDKRKMEIRCLKNWRVLVGYAAGQAYAQHV
ncbi:NACHT domain- and WD repeat-containing protein 1-like [Babylonia areolata]|uniref:NACHT domain- and WD repeat-containing protein 1-like n=1 Tax=Babylonia areolata TaxID=304850 RepID=UPI003FD19B44